MRQGFAADPTDPEHIAAYVAMRQVSHRVTGQSFMDYLQSQVGSEVRAVLKSSFTQFWAVPKSSFRGGLPPATAEFLVPDHQLDDMAVRGGVTIDRQKYYVVDQVVPRESLGRNVHTLELDVTNSTRVAQRPASTLWSSPAASGRKRPAAARKRPAAALPKTQRDRDSDAAACIASDNFWELSTPQRHQMRARLMRMDPELDPEESLSSGSPDRSSSEGGRESVSCAHPRGHMGGAARSARRRFFWIVI